MTINELLRHKDLVRFKYSNHLRQSRKKTHQEIFFNKVVRCLKCGNDFRISHASYLSRTCSICQKENSRYRGRELETCL